MAAAPYGSIIWQHHMRSGCACWAGNNQLVVVLRSSDIPAFKCRCLDEVVSAPGGHGRCCTCTHSSYNSRGTLLKRWVEVKGEEAVWR